MGRLSRQVEGAAPLGRRSIFFNPRVPPLAIAIGEIRRKLDAESSFAVVFRLDPHPLPRVVGERMRHKAAVLPGIGAVPLLIERERHDGAIFIIPFAG